MKKEIEGNFLYKKIIKNIFKFGVVLLIILISCDIFYTYFFFKNDIKNMCIYTNSKNKKVIENTLKTYKDLASAMASDSSFTNSNISLFKRIDKSKIYEENFNVNFIGISNENGLLVNSLDNKIRNISDRCYFKRAIANKKNIVSDLVNDKITGEKSYIICTPYYHNEILGGTILVSIQFDEIEKIIKEHTNTMYSAIIDNNNKILTHSFNKEIIGKNIFQIGEKIIGKPSKILDNKFISKGTYYSYSKIKNILYFTSFDQIKDTNWIVFNIININEYLNLSIYILILKIFVITFFLIIISKILFRYLAKDTFFIDKFILETSILTEEKVSEQNLKKLLKYTSTAFEDPLTKTLRRDIFIRKVKKSLKISSPEKISLILFIDLDNLKQINDYLGHDVGDITLINFTYKIKTIFSKYNYLLSRYGGDEFLVFIKDIDVKELEEIEMSLNKKLASVVLDTDIKYSASIGISIYPWSSTKLEGLIKIADSEVYKAKKEGKNCTRVHRV